MSDKKDCNDCGDDLIQLGEQTGAVSDKTGSKRYHCLGCGVLFIIIELAGEEKARVPIPS